MTRALSQLQDELRKVQGIWLDRDAPDPRGFIKDFISQILKAQEREMKEELKGIWPKGLTCDKCGEEIKGDEVEGMIKHKCKDKEQIIKEGK